MKLLGASLFTLTIISSFVLFVVILILLYLETFDIWFAIELTVSINFLLWLFGPYITDFFNKWLYKVKFLKKEEVERLYPEIAQIINEVTTKYRFKFPKVGIIPDKNPTAYTYGSARFNSRIILTEGLFHYLNKQEAQAVVAHELGHIVNRDFIVMMVASTLVQILYEIYAVLKRARGKKAGYAKAIVLISYGLYILGVYALFYLSRTRETLADEFSAKVTSAQDLANGLIKIAYGIVEATDDERSTRLMESTRHLGVVDVKNAKHIGVMAHISHNDPKVLAEVMVFDKINPWAKLIELSSTHPLTGNRLDHLSDISKKSNKPFSYNVDEAIQRLQVDRAKLYGGFSYGLLIYFAPFILLFIFLFYMPLVLVPAAIGVGLLIQLMYRYPYGKAIETTILEEMRNPYASPIHGQRITLSGKVVGRGIPGYIFSEDMMFQDRTGLTFLDYNSLFGFIGDLFFAVKKIKKLFDVPAKAEGWFFRGMSSMVALSYIQTEKDKVRSHPILWSLLLPVILVGVSVYLYFFSDAISSRLPWSYPIWEFITGGSQV